MIRRNLEVYNGKLCFMRGLECLCVVLNCKGLVEWWSFFEEVVALFDVVNFDMSKCERDSRALGTAQQNTDI